MEMDLSEESGARMESELAAHASDITSPLFILSLFFGSAMSLLGGYVCARYARASWRRAAVILGILMVLVGLAYVGSGPILPTIALSLLSGVLVYAGAWLGGRRFDAGGLRA